MTNNVRTPLALLGTAIAVTAGNPANAATVLVSKAQSGFTPVTVTATTGSFSFDVDGNGSNDFTIVGDGSTNVLLQYANANTSGAATFASSLLSYSTPSDLSIGSVKSGGSAFFNPNVATTSNAYFAVATNATFDSISRASSGTLGYLRGTVSSAAGGSFTLNDFGLVTDGTVSAVPEPDSWVVLLGGIGVAGGALRRARKTKGAAASLAA